MIHRSKFHDRITVFEKQFETTKQYLAMRVSNSGRDCDVYVVITQGMREKLQFTVCLVSDWKTEIRFANLDRGTDIQFVAPASKVYDAINRLVDTIFSFEDDFKAI